MKIVALLLLFGVTTLNLNGQTIAVKDERFVPIQGVSIFQEKDSTLFITNAQGQSDIPNLSGFYTISKVGYETYRTSLNSSENVILKESIKTLNDVTVEGFLDNGKLSNQASSISKLRPSDLDRFDNFSIVDAVNTTPGIRFEQRAAASYRISIRGSSIRSPFGIRNVKVYWNGLPFTEPGGNTFLNLLDVLNMQELEIMRGPSASAFGAGNGGVIKINSTSLGANANTTQVGAQFGDFNSNRFSLSTNYLNDSKSWTFKLARQSSDGYREHNKMERTVFEWDQKYFLNHDDILSVSLLYSDLEYQIPGGLNPDQKADNPRQSRPRSIERNASVANELFLVQTSYQSKIGSQWNQETNVGLSFNQFVNPFILDFKRDNQQALNLRSTFKNDFQLLGKPATVNLGVEYQKAFFDGKNFGNVAGQADTIRFADEIEITQGNLFSKLDLKLSSKTNLSLGLSANELSYHIDRLVDRINNSPQSFKKNFDAFIASRVGLSHAINSNYSLHLSFMNGYSPPTTTEVRTNEGSINRALQAEVGTNYELNFRGQLNSTVSFDLAVFYFNLGDAITTFTNDQGVVLFRNAGGTNQFGIESQINLNWIKGSNGFLNDFKSQVSYTYHDFSFDDYITGGDNFSGNALPGTAPHTFSLRSDLVLRNGLSANFTYQYVDPIPLNDENTVFGQAYNLINARVNYDFLWNNGNVSSIYFGVNNLLDISYSLGNDLNAFGRRFFQPAPTRNFYFGLNLRFKH